MLWDASSHDKRPKNELRRCDVFSRLIFQKIATKCVNWSFDKTHSSQDAFLWKCQSIHPWNWASSLCWWEEVSDSWWMELEVRLFRQTLQPWSLFKECVFYLLVYLFKLHPAKVFDSLKCFWPRLMQKCSDIWGCSANVQFVIPHSGWFSFCCTAEQAEYFTPRRLKWDGEPCSRYLDTFQQVQTSSWFSWPPELHRLPAQIFDLQLIYGGASSFLLFVLSIQVCSVACLLGCFLHPQGAE